MKLENYELDKFLGKGAFGEVYLTTKKGESKKFATKKLDREEMEKEQERLKKEGKCTSCHGYGKTPDGRYICPTCNGTGMLQEDKK